MKKQDKLFVEYVKKQCDLFGVKLELRDVRYLRLNGKIKCSGYFDDGDDINPVIVVATKRKDWLEILVHEYCHFTQWMDKIKLWPVATTSLYHIDRWLAGEKIRNAKYHLSVARDLELDNEKRAVKMIKKWNLNIDADSYVRKANAYVQFYNYIYKTRRWSDPKNSPYTNKNLISQMPGKFNMNYKKMSKRVEKIFIKENI